MARTYFVISEGAGILNPGDRPFRSLSKAQSLAATAAEECSWECQTPPSPDNEVSRGRGNFRCGVTAAHGIHIRKVEGGRYLDEEEDVPDEGFRKAKSTQRADWILEYVIDRGTGFTADGEGSRFYAGPLRWRDGDAEQWDRIIDDIASGDQILEATVTPLQHGRYWHLMDDQGSEYPLVYKNGGFE